MIDTIKWTSNGLRIVDQTKLPVSEEYLFLNNLDAIIEAIITLKIRGAPALGITGAYGMAISLREYSNLTNNFPDYIQATADRIIKVRPTAVNLSCGVNRIKDFILKNSEPSADRLFEKTIRECKAYHDEDIAICKKIGENGSELISDGMSILTHCNTGGLATGGFGTALGVIETTVMKGKKVHVFVSETRPLLQGARLTAWELSRSGIPYTLICDNMAGYFMQQGKVDCVIVGADRITRKGDAANKIGTYTLAVLCEKHKIPFYVAAPNSTIDPSLSRPEEIAIEFRNADEIKKYRKERFAPTGANALNPAFDVTPSSMISAIITETGIHRGSEYDFSFLKNITH